MAKLFDTAKKTERAILVGVISQNQRKEEAEEHLNELEFLAATAGAKVEKMFLQQLAFPNPRTFLGTGKLEEVEAYVIANEIDIIIFDDELSPSQLRNIERTIKCKILDRSNLILDIFANRAKTAQARLQVELAQSQYLLPRLTRMWTHLSRYQGGIGMKGPGETEIETDRRALRDKIAKLKERLALIEKQSQTQRNNRDDKVRVALVGYTNVGKSTLMNLLTKSSLDAEDKLFSTLDSTVRKVVIEAEVFLLSDTVGFIRKLPHQLIESFKSTLQEVREADILIHVADVSHPHFEDQLMTVTKTLEEIGASKKPVLHVFNKIDKLAETLNTSKDEDNVSPYILQLKNTWMAKENNPVVFVSATNKTNISELSEVLLKMIKNKQLKKVKS